MSVALERESGTLPLVRERVRGLLAESAAYQSLSPERQRDLAADMEKVAAFIVGGETGDNVPRAASLAGAPMARRISGGGIYDPAGQTAGQRFAQAGAGAAQQGAAAYTGMIRDVNFPAFVAGLIDGVFNAIVTSSIKQMDAYAELVKNVAKSVDQFMKDNISENQARDYLANRYPDNLEVDTTGQQPVLKPKEGSDDAALPNFFSDLGLSSPVTSLDQDTTEQVLVPAARKRMAMDRQQLLATMVLMGINRLVVTDGSIDASCTFTLDTKDSVARHYDRAVDYDSHWKSGQKGQTKENNWYSPSDYSWDSSANFTVSTHQTEDSAASIDMHAKLGGKVKVNFKSDYFPLEKIADVLQINEIQQKAPSALRAAPAPGAPAAPAPPANPPAAPGR